MAIATLRRLDELIQECESLGLNLIPTKRRKRTSLKEGECPVKYIRPAESNDYVLVPSKDDCIQVLREYYIAEKKRLGTYTKMLDFMLSMDSPMLALQFKECKPDIQAEIKRDGSRYIYEEKIDGCRMVTGFFKDTGFEFYSRNTSVSDYLPISYTGNIYYNVDTSKLTDEFVIDGEIVPTRQFTADELQDNGLVADTQLSLVSSILALNPEESMRIQKEVAPLKIKVFDLLQLNGVKLYDKPYKERRKLLVPIVKQLQEIGFLVEFPPNNISAKMTKEEFYSTIIKRGGEGCVAKDINATYDTTGRRHPEWVKIKRTMSQSALMEGYGDSIDAFVIGFDKADPDKAWANLIGSLSLGVYLTDDEGNYKRDENGDPVVHHIAQVSNITEEMRKAFTTYDENNEPILRPEIYGMVFSIDGQDLSSKSHRFSHARIIERRPDRSADTCKMKESFMLKMIL